MPHTMHTVLCNTHRAWCSLVWSGKSPVSSDLQSLSPVLHPVIHPSASPLLVLQDASSSILQLGCSPKCQKCGWPERQSQVYQPARVQSVVGVSGGERPRNRLEWVPVAAQAPHDTAPRGTAPPRGLDPARGCGHRVPQCLVCAGERGSCVSWGTLGSGWHLFTLRSSPDSPRCQEECGECTALFPLHLTTLLSHTSRPVFVSTPRAVYCLGHPGFSLRG